MNPVACYTAVAADYDPLTQVPEMDGVDFIAFVDDPSSALRAGWEPRALPTEPGVMGPRMRAKEPKLLPHEVLPEYEVTLWVDASHRIISSQSILGPLTQLAAGDAGFALHRHPWRDCIYTEAVASLDLWKYASQPIEEQVDSYRERGHPEHWGLWACGSMARVNGDRVNAAMDRWWMECRAWTYQDQLSLPFVMREAGWLPDVFPHHQVFSNPWFSIAEHPNNNL